MDSHRRNILFFSLSLSSDKSTRNLFKKESPVINVSSLWNVEDSVWYFTYPQISPHSLTPAFFTRNSLEKDSEILFPKQSDKGIYMLGYYCVNLVLSILLSFFFSPFLSSYQRRINFGFASSIQSNYISENWYWRNWRGRKLNESTFPINFPLRLEFIVISFLILALLR